ncbi:Cysteine-rich receptor-like protein kinase 19 [Zea mays]|uniref:Cysteine-rich receptor-like protein kinase 19 n=1 Tax=Zea mays TaxID=4577 RepID=A0A3L6EY26_MAIZE|nr:Cysteine-rich receptor-like protein kinase 19 [Zea mays]
MHNQGSFLIIWCVLHQNRLCIALNHRMRKTVFDGEQGPKSSGKSETEACSPCVSACSKWLATRASHNLMIETSSWRGCNTSSNELKHVLKLCSQRLHQRGDQGLKVQRCLRQERHNNSYDKHDRRPYHANRWVEKLTEDSDVHGSSRLPTGNGGGIHGQTPREHCRCARLFGREGHGLTGTVNESGCGAVRRARIGRRGSYALDIVVAGDLDVEDDYGVPQFSLSQLNAATNEFSEGCVVERGYYKGVLHDGLDVAIKKLSVSDDIQERRLQLELNIRAKLEHGNILKLLGYCLDAQEKEKLYFLVEEYIPNVESLEKFINANILVRSDMNPVIINFGSSILLDRDDDKITGDAVAGTLGYVAPEKLMEAYASMMSDVFSFGIIIIEIITGRRASPFVDLPEWGSVDEMITSAKGLFDPALANESQLMKINRCREVGLKCIERDPKRRPTMGNVLEMLSS